MVLKRFVFLISWVMTSHKTFFFLLLELSNSTRLFPSLFIYIFRDSLSHSVDTVDKLLFISVSRPVFCTCVCVEAEQARSGPGNCIVIDASLDESSKSQKRYKRFEFFYNSSFSGKSWQNPASIRDLKINYELDRGIRLAAF